MQYLQFLCNSLSSNSEKNNDVIANNLGSSPITSDLYKLYDNLTSTGLGCAVKFEAPSHIFGQRMFCQEDMLLLYINLSLATFEHIFHAALLGSAVCSCEDSSPTGISWVTPFS